MALPMAQSSVLSEHPQVTGSASIYILVGGKFGCDETAIGTASCHNRFCGLTRLRAESSCQWLRSERGSRKAPDFRS